MPAGRVRELGVALSRLGRLYSMSMRRRTVLAAGAAAVVGGCSTPSLPAGDPNSFAVRRVRVFDGERLTGDDTVLVERGRIVSVGRGLSVPQGTAVVDGRGGVLLPGLIDSHVHVSSVFGSDALQFGVTTVLDMFCDAHLLASFRAPRVGLARVSGADVWSAGTLATVPGGHGTQFHLAIPTVADSTDLDRFVADRIREGSDFIKVIIEDGSMYGRSVPTLTAAQVRGLISAAHAHQVLAAAHVSTVAAARVALDAGADVLAHVPADAGIGPGLAADVGARTRGVITTLSILSVIGCTPDAVALRDDPRVGRYLSPAQRDELGSRYPACRAGTLETAMANVAALHRANVSILAGTDSGNPGTAAGASLLGELGLLVRAGLSPVETLRAATSVPARCFNLADRGRVAPGLRADLVLVHGNPITAIDDIRDVVAVWKNGYLVPRAASS